LALQENYKARRKLPFRSVVSKFCSMAPVALYAKSTTQITVVNGAQKSNSVTVGVLSISTIILTVLNQDFTVNSVTNPPSLGSVVALM